MIGDGRKSYAITNNVAQGYPLRGDAIDDAKSIGVCNLVRAMARSPSRKRAMLLRPSSSTADKLHALHQCRGVQHEE